MLDIYDVQHSFSIEEIILSDNSSMSKQARRNVSEHRLTLDTLRQLARIL